MSDGAPGGTTTPSTARPHDASIWQYPLDLGAAITVERNQDDQGFTCRPLRTFAAASPAWGLSQDDLAAARTLVHARSTRRAPNDSAPVPGLAAPQMSGDEGPEEESGIAEAFVNLLRHEVIPPVPGFRVVRLVPPPEAHGERPVEDESASSVVVGERVVVTWVRQVQDSDHEAPRTLAHLDAVGHFEVPETHGMLLWTAPSGREVPVAWATKYLPRARDGWDWCLELAQRALGVTSTGRSGGSDSWASDFPARLGRTAAKLHLALATPSAILPEPTAVAPADLVRAWHAAARRLVGEAERVARDGTLEGVADVLIPRLGLLQAAVDHLGAVADASEALDGEQVLIQRVHGDLHVGQILRWPGGLAVVDFHPCPMVEVDGLSVGQAMQPAARDIARLLRSLDHVARVVDKGTGFAMTDRVDAWSCAARARLLDAYRSELAEAGRSNLLDERLLPAFEAEQLCREIVYASEHLPSWVYAPLGGLWQSFESDCGRAAQVGAAVAAADQAVADQAATGRRRHGRRARTPRI